MGKKNAQNIRKCETTRSTVIQQPRKNARSGYGTEFFSRFSTA